MTSHSEKVINEFLKLCDWLFQTYQMRKYLFDENTDIDFLKTPKHQHFFYRIQEIIQESWMHQLAKLHDPAVQGGSVNLSIDYIIEFGSWEKSIESKLIDLKKSMLALYGVIKVARNKLLSHNDLKTILGEEAYFGSFDPGEDTKYFQALLAFCNVVSQAALSKPFVYDDLVKNDVDGFMAQFKRGKT